MSREEIERGRRFLERLYESEEGDWFTAAGALYLVLAFGVDGGRPVEVSDERCAALGRVLAQVTP